MAKTKTKFADIDNKSKHVVSGFIRQKHKENKLKSSKYVLFQNVPVVISSLCTFYYHSRDYFTLDFVHEDAEILNNGKTLKQRPMDKLRFCTYNLGSMQIPSTLKCICKWQIKIDKSPNGIVCGILSAPYGNFKNIIWENYFPLTHNDSKTKNAEDYMAYVCDNGRRYVTSAVHDPMGKRHYYIKFKTGDIIEICLDLFDRVLRFQINNNQNKIFQFKEIKVSQSINYRLVIVMCLKDLCVSIVKFDQIFKQQK